MSARTFGDVPLAALLAGLLLPVGARLARAASQAPAFTIVSVEGGVSLAGRPVQAGAALRDGDRLKVEGRATLRGAGYVLRISSPALVEVLGAPKPGFSIASGSVLAVREGKRARLFLNTPGAALDLGYPEFYAEPREGAHGAATYVCACSPGRGERRHIASLWSSAGFSPAPGLDRHTDDDLAMLRRWSRRRTRSPSAQ